MEDAVGEEGGDDIGGDVGGPEVCEARGELAVLVEVGEVEDDLGWELGEW